MSNTQQTNWYKLLLDKINCLCEEFGLDDSQTNQFKDFVVSLAKEQYKIGNKYGASWAFKRAREETPRSSPAHAMA